MLQKQCQVWIKALPIEAGASVFCHSRGVWPCSEFVAIVLRLSPNKALMSVSKRPVSLVKELNLCLFAAAVYLIWSEFFLPMSLLYDSSPAFVLTVTQTHWASVSFSLVIRGTYFSLSEFSIILCDVQIRCFMAVIKSYVQCIASGWCQQ